MLVICDFVNLFQGSFPRLLVIFCVFIFNFLAMDYT